MAGPDNEPGDGEAHGEAHSEPGEAHGEADGEADDGPDDEPLLPASDDTASRAAPGQYRRRGPGCVWQLVFFAIMVVLGVVAAATLRGRSHDTSGTTLATGSASAEKGNVAWKVKTSVDDQRARCINLYVDDDQDALTGGCISPGLEAMGSDVHEAPIPGSKVWVIFGLAPKGAPHVRLPLTNGTSKVLNAESKDGMADRFYIWPAPAGVHTAGDAVLEGS